MTATNHAAAGALIALTVNKPILALPLAFLSHFVLDAFPHFGYEGNRGYGEAFKHKLTYIVILLDIVGLMLLLWAVAGKGWLVYVAGIVALSPDLLGLYNYFGIDRKHKDPSQFIINKLHRKFHRQIEWCERPWGIFIEIVIAIILIGLIWKN